MNELEGMINGLLQNPDEMKKLMDMAGKILSSEPSDTGGGNTEPERGALPDLSGILSNLGNTAGGSAPSSTGLPDLSGILGKLGGDYGSIFQTAQQLFGNGAIQKLVSMGSALGAKNDKKELIEAMKPWLSEERRHRLDKAMVFAKVMRVAGVASVFKKGGAER